MPLLHSLNGGGIKTVLPVTKLNNYGTQNSYFYVLVQFCIIFIRFCINRCAVWRKITRTIYQNWTWILFSSYFLKRILDNNYCYLQIRAHDKRSVWPVFRAALKACFRFLVGLHVFTGPCCCLASFTSN